MAASIDNDSDDDGLVVCREDLAALCVQCLLSLSWEKSRCLSVKCVAPLRVDGGTTKRVDQEWCVNSDVLEDVLAGID